MGGSRARVPAGEWAPSGVETAAHASLPPCPPTQEYCAKGSLLEAIDRGALLAPGGGPNLAAVLMAAREIAGAMVYLHSQGVIHGDLTPSNILLQAGSRDARRWVCKVGGRRSAGWPRPPLELDIAAAPWSLPAL